MVTNIFPRKADGVGGKVQPYSSPIVHSASSQFTDAQANNLKQHFRVLLVEGDYDLAQPILVGLEHAGFEVHYAPDMAGALHTLQEHDLHLIIIDLGLANSQAPSLCRTVRHLSNMPLILTGSDCNVKTQVHAFHLGADDYVGQPCDPRLLVGRTAALLRRSYRYSQPRLPAGQSGAMHPAGTMHPAGASQHRGASRDTTASTQPGTQQASQHAAGSTQEDTLHTGDTLHPQSHLPKGWATCDTCGYIGPLEKFANPDSKAGLAEFHTVLCCPNCQHEDVARFTVG